MSLVVWWDDNFRKVVGRTNGSFVRPVNVLPEVNLLAWSIGFEKLFQIRNEDLNWQVYREQPFDSWAPVMVAPFIRHLLRVLDENHDRHCHYETYDSTSNLQGESVQFLTITFAENTSKLSIFVTLESFAFYLYFQWCKL